MKQHETDQFVFLHVDAHVPGCEFIAADGAAVGADFGIVQDEIHQRKSQQGQDHVSRRTAEKPQGGIQRLLFTSGGDDGDAFEDQHQSHRHDHGRNVQLIIQKTDQQANQHPAPQAADDKSGIPELFGKDHAHDRGKHDVGADSEIEQAHHHDEIQPASADGIDNGGLEIGI